MHGTAASGEAARGGKRGPFSAPELINRPVAEASIAPNTNPTLGADAKAALTRSVMSVRHDVPSSRESV